MFSKSFRYSIMALIYLASHSLDGQMQGLESLSEELKISKPLMAGVMQQLVKKELVSSKKGRNGGFYLTAQQKQVSLWDVFNTLLGPILNHVEVVDEHGDAIRHYNDILYHIQLSIQGTVEEKTLEDFANKMSLNT